MVKDFYDRGDMDRDYAVIQKRLEAMRHAMRKTWNRFPEQTDWSPAIARLEKVLAAVREARDGEAFAGATVERS